MIMVQTYCALDLIEELESTKYYMEPKMSPSQVWEYIFIVAFVGDVSNIEICLHILSIRPVMVAVGEWPFSKHNSIKGHLYS
jgi:hypothetical protein